MAWVRDNDFDAGLGSKEEFVWCFWLRWVCAMDSEVLGRVREWDEV